MTLGTGMGLAHDSDSGYLFGPQQPGWNSLFFSSSLCSLKSPLLKKVSSPFRDSLLSLF